jgi:hypothetical protein
MLRSKAPGVLVDSLPARERITRVQINGNVKLRNLGPKDFILRLVTVFYRVLVVNIAVAVDQRTFEAKLLNERSSSFAAAAGFCNAAAANPAYRSGWRALLVQPTLRTDRDEKVSAAGSHNVERPCGPERCVVEANVDVSSS